MHAGCVCFAEKEGLGFMYDHPPRDGCLLECIFFFKSMLSCGKARFQHTQLECCACVNAWPSLAEL